MSEIDVRIVDDPAATVASLLVDVACAGVVPAILPTSLGWRGVYFVGAIPLLLMAVARRSLRETRRFTELSLASLVVMSYGEVGPNVRASAMEMVSLPGVDA